MLCYTSGAFILLPQSLLGLILLASQGFNSGSRNDTYNLEVDDISDDQFFGMPSSNLERTTIPLEWDDISLKTDFLHHRRRNSKQQRHRHGLEPRNDVFDKTEDIEVGMPNSDVVTSIKSVDKSYQTRKKRSKLDVEPYFIRSNRYGSMYRQQSVESSSSVASEVKPNLQSYSQMLHSVTVYQQNANSQHLGQHHPVSSLATVSSSSLEGKSHSSSKGSNIFFQQEDVSFDMRNSTSPSAVRSSYTPSGFPKSSKSRQKRRTPNVARVKLSQMGMHSGIGQPIILRKRNRIDAKVGVLVVIENSIYRQYLVDNGNNPRAALARIRRYYGMIFSMMDQRFQTIHDPYLSVSVSISGILVAESREDSSWLEQIVDWTTVRSHGRGSVLTDRALKKFSKWISGRADLIDFDHAMVFTSYRLTNKQGVSLGGMAYLNAICDTKSGNAVSIVADSGDFQSVKVATHELAHSLGAYHDGDRQSKTCRSDSNYVMSPLTSHENHVLRNAFYFSPCSIRDMSYHLSKTSSSCVKNDPPVYYSYDLQRLPPGQLYSPDMQCKLIFGKKSEYCREGNLVDIMCGQLWCRDPNKDNGCRTNTYLTALPGTECGPNSVCHLGECIIDNSKNTIQRQPASSLISINSRVIQRNQSSSRMQGPKKHDPRNFKHRTRSNKHVRRKRRNRCTEDKNPDYCEGLIRLNPGGCERRAIRQYCCLTCRLQRRQRPRRI